MRRTNHGMPEPSIDTAADFRGNAVRREHALGLFTGDTNVVSFVRGEAVTRAPTSTDLTDPYSDLGSEECDVWARSGNGMEAYDGSEDEYEGIGIGEELSADTVTVAPTPTPWATVLLLGLGAAAFLAFARTYKRA